MKMNEFQSVIAITDQLLAMAPTHAKTLFFRGKAYVALKEFDQGVEILEKLVELNPDDASFKQELANAKKAKTQEAQRLK